MSCYAPGTPLAKMGRLTVSPTDGSAAAFRVEERWTRTATDGFVFSRGEPITLTWGVVPDGTMLPGTDESSTSRPSDLRARLNELYGNENVWLPIIESVFQRWGQITGITYKHEPNDDASNLSFVRGQLGLRPDIRIGGRLIDGDGGILGFNYFPSGGGDMVLDTHDAFFDNVSNDSLRLRNVISHEHGHGLGLDHVCPTDQTKLMEPFASTAFDGPQHDDILGSQRLYGDAHEPNNGHDEATELGNPLDGVKNASYLGLDGAGDEDWFRFSTKRPDESVRLRVSPRGRSYLEGPVDASDSCGAGTSFNSASQRNLEVTLFAEDGVTALAGSDVTGAGGVESIQHTLGDAGDYFIRVRGNASDVTQLYDLQWWLNGSPDHLEDFNAFPGIVGDPPLHLPNDTTDSTELIWGDATTSSKGFTITAANAFDGRSLEFDGSEETALRQRDELDHYENNDHQLAFWFRFSDLAASPNDSFTQVIAPYTHAAQTEVDIAYLLRCGRSPSGVIGAGLSIPSGDTTLAHQPIIPLTPAVWHACVVQFTSASSDAEPNAGIRLWFDPESARDAPDFQIVPEDGIMGSYGGVGHLARYAFGAAVFAADPNGPTVWLDHVASWDGHGQAGINDLDAAIRFLYPSITYEAWSNEHFGAVLNIESDEDADEWPNGLEFLLGTNAMAGNDVVVTSEVGDSETMFTYNRNPAAQGMREILEASTDMDVWVEVTPSSESVERTGPLEAVRLTIPNGEDARLFYRLRTVMSLE